MHLIQTTIPIGLDKPFRVLHISDSHIAYADARDDDRKMELARSRQAIFEQDRFVATNFLQEHLAYAAAHQLPILHTGDLCDFVSYANLEFAREILRDTDYFMVAGNHEFSQYIGEAFEDVPYKMQTYHLVQYYFRNSLFFASRVIGGVNFVAVNSGYYQFEPGMLHCLQEEVKKGLPIVLMMHAPLHADDLYHFIMDEKKQPCAYLCGTPEHLMRGYSAHRFRQQRPTWETLEFIDYVNQEKQIRAVLAGHLHENFEGRLPGGAMQYITGGGYKGYAREILFT